MGFSAKPWRHRKKFIVAEPKLLRERAKRKQVRSRYPEQANLFDDIL